MAVTGQLNRRQRRGRVGISSEQEAKEKRRLRGVDECGIVPSEPWIDACFGYLTDRAPDGSLIEYRTFREECFPPGGDETAMTVCPICGRTVPPNSIERWTLTEITMIDPMKVRARRLALGLTVMELIRRIGLDGLGEWASILNRQQNATELTREEFAEALECEPVRLTRVRAIHFRGCMDHKPQELHAAHGASPSATAIATLQYRNLRLDLTKLPSEQTSDLKREIRRYERTGIVRGK
jgi:hypothetical protein